MQDAIKKQAELHALIAEIYALQAKVLSMDVANQERLAGGDTVAYYEESFTDYADALMKIKLRLEEF